MKTRRIIGAAGLVLCAGFTAFGAQAGDGYDAPLHRLHNRSAVIGSAGLPSYVPGVGTYSGSIVALRIKGNGIFLARNNLIRRDGARAFPVLTEARKRSNSLFLRTSGRKTASHFCWNCSSVYAHRPAPVAKIIDVTSENQNSACAYELGVCVIRP